MRDLDRNRATTYRKNNNQELVLEEMNTSLVEKEIKLISAFSKPQFPIIFIVGAQRSGTTVLMQSLIQYFQLSYPNNFIARYWKAPYIGAMLFKNLSSNLDENTLDLSSDLGYTKGLSGPHEFGYFWKRWFPVRSWEKKENELIDYSLLEKELSAWETVENTPLIFKNIIDVSFNIQKLSEIFPNAFFIHIKRQPEFVVQSTYLSRIKFFNDEKEWLGLEPPEYEALKRLDTFDQISAQVFYSRRFIENALLKKKNNSLTINYEDFISNSEGIISEIGYRLKLKTRNIHLPQLINTNKIKLPEEKFNLIRANCKKYFN